MSKARRDPTKETFRNYRQRPMDRPMQAFVTNVIQRPVAAPLEVDAPAGQTYFILLDPTGFREGGGLVELWGADATTGVPYDYTTLEEDPETGDWFIRLASPLGEAWPQGTLAIPQPARYEYLADIMLDFETRATITARVPYSWRNILALGTRDDEEAETVSYYHDGRQYVLLDLLGYSGKSGTGTEHNHDGLYAPIGHTHEGATGTTLPGTVILWAGSVAGLPAGWLPCWGQEVPRTLYPNLFTTIGETFGAGDGGTTFNLPDLRDRFPLGSRGDPIGRTGGSLKHTHSAGSLRSGPGGGHKHSSAGLSTPSSGGHDHPVSGSTGGAGSHNHPAGSLGTTGAGAPSSGWQAAYSTPRQGHVHDVTGSTGSGGNHSHGDGSLNAGSSGSSHSHNVQGSTGDVGAHDHGVTGQSGNESHEPPYTVMHYVIWSGTAATAPPSPPSADFIGAPVQGAAPLQVQFTDLTNGTVSAYSWQFGDGTQSTDRNPLKTYTTPGAYAVTLTVSGPDGTDTLTKTGYITVYSAGEALVASFDANPETGPAPLEVTFTDTSIGQVTERTWDFGDLPDPLLHYVAQDLPLGATSSWPSHLGRGPTLGGFPTSPSYGVAEQPTVLNGRRYVSFTDPAVDSKGLGYPSTANGGAGLPTNPDPEATLIVVAYLDGQSTAGYSGPAFFRPIGIGLGLSSEPGPGYQQHVYPFSLGTEGDVGNCPPGTARSRSTSTPAGPHIFSGTVRASDYAVLRNQVDGDPGTLINGWDGPGSFGGLVIGASWGGVGADGKANGGGFFGSVAEVRFYGTLSDAEYDAVMAELKATYGIA